MNKTKFMEQKFMEQKAKDMSVTELATAIKLKEKQNSEVALGEPKVGDTVRVVKYSRNATIAGMYEGKIGILRRIDKRDTKLPYLVEIGNHTHWTQKVELVSKTIKGDIEVRDKVRAKPWRECYNCKGRILTVTRIGDGIYPITCEGTKNGVNEIFKKDALELVAKATKEEIEVNDTVRIIEDWKGHCPKGRDGKIGKVTGLRCCTDFPYRVKCEGDKEGYLCHKVELVAKATKEVVEEHPKSLSDKYIETIDIPSYRRYKEKDVKEAVNEFLDWMDSDSGSFKYMKDKLKELFGDRIMGVKE